MFSKIFILFTIITITTADYYNNFNVHHAGGHGVSSQSVVRQHIPGFGGVDEHSHEKHAYPKYTFKYTVSDHLTNDQKTHWESRDGDKVEGQYSLLQPDGATRTVSYNVNGHSGFNAIVQTNGGHSGNGYNGYGYH